MPRRPVRPVRAALGGAVVLPVLVGSLAAPASGGSAGDADRVVRLTRDAGSVVGSAEVPLAPGTTRLETSTYSMVAATWRGPTPRVAVRRSPAEPWQRLPRLADGPSADSAEGVSGPHGTDLVWIGDDTGLDVRVVGTGQRDLRLVLIDPGALPNDARAVSHPTAAPRTEPPPTDEPAPEPELHTRRDWGADDSLRNGHPRYNDRLKQVHIHHTATGNDYGRSDVPGLIRGMYAYHTQSLGWFDIGYNFLVDRFGRTWIGRSGGPRRLVRGAHTLGFNQASVGIAVIGTHTRRAPSRRTLRAIVRLAAWKLDRYDRWARGPVWVTSTGSDRYRDGRRVELPAIDGHRDTNETACPGTRLYNRLPTLRRQTQRRLDRFG